LKIRGTVERDPPIFWDDRGIGLLKLVEHEKLIRIKELQRPELPKDLNQGEKITAEVNEGDRYYFLISLERGEAASSEDEKQIGLSTYPPAEQPPKPYTPTREKNLPPTPGKGRACSTRFMARFRELVKAGKTPEEIADEYCFSTEEVYQNIAALETKEKIEQKLTQVSSEKRFDTDFDSVRPTHYRLISRVPDEEKQVELARKVAEENLTVRELEKEIEGPKPPEPPREEEIDQNITIPCKTCGMNFHVIHVRAGKHRLEEVMVVEKA
jgi:hypothetical protein